MPIHLPAAYAGYKSSVLGSRQDCAGLARVLSVLAEGHAEVALEREWRLTMALALRHLPSGACLMTRDSKGREWYIGPADQVKAQALQEAA